MKRIAGAIAALGTVLAMSGSMDAASPQDMLAGHATLTDGSHMTVAAVRSNNVASGSITVLEGTSGARVTGKVVCLGHWGPGVEVIFARVGSSDDPFLPDGSYLMSEFDTGSSHRIAWVSGGYASPRWSVNPDGTCSPPYGGVRFSGHVTSGAIIAY